MKVVAALLCVVAGVIFATAAAVTGAPAATPKDPYRGPRLAGSKVNAFAFNVHRHMLHHKQTSTVFSPFALYTSLEILRSASGDSKQLDHVLLHDSSAATPTPTPLPTPVPTPTTPKSLQPTSPADVSDTADFSQVYRAAMDATTTDTDVVYAHGACSVFVDQSVHVEPSFSRSLKNLFRSELETLDFAMNQRKASTAIGAFMAQQLDPTTMSSDAPPVLTDRELAADTFLTKLVIASAFKLMPGGKGVTTNPVANTDATPDSTPVVASKAAPSVTDAPKQPPAADTHDWSVFGWEPGPMRAFYAGAAGVDTTFVGTMRLPFARKRGVTTFGDTGVQVITFPLSALGSSQADEQVKEKLVMTIIQPTDCAQYPVLAAGMNTDVLHAMDAAAEPIEDGLDVVMPQFYVMMNDDVTPVMRSMGVSHPFDGSTANLSSLASDGVTIGLHVDRLVHGARLQASTSQSTATSTSKRNEFVVDRPFMYIVRDMRANIIVHLGHVANPEAMLIVPDATDDSDSASAVEQLEQDEMGGCMTTTAPLSASFTKVANPTRTCASFGSDCTQCLSGTATTGCAFFGDRCIPEECPKDARHCVSTKKFALPVSMTPPDSDDPAWVKPLQQCALLRSRVTAQAKCVVQSQKSCAECTKIDLFAAAHLGTAENPPHCQWDPRDNRCEAMCMNGDDECKHLITHKDTCPVATPDDKEATCAGLDCQECLSNAAGCAVVGEACVPLADCASDGVDNCDATYEDGRSDVDTRAVCAKLGDDWINEARCRTAKTCGACLYMTEQPETTFSPPVPMRTSGAAPFQCKWDPEFGQCHYKCPVFAAKRCFARNGTGDQCSMSPNDTNGSNAMCAAHKSDCATCLANKACVFAKGECTGSCPPGVLCTTGAEVAAAQDPKLSNVENVCLIIAQKARDRAKCSAQVTCGSCLETDVSDGGQCMYDLESETCMADCPFDNDECDRKMRSPQSAVTANRDCPFETPCNQKDCNACLMAPQCSYVTGQCFAGKCRAGMRACRSALTFDMHSSDIDSFCASDFRAERERVSCENKDGCVECLTSTISDRTNMPDEACVWDPTLKFCGALSTCQGRNALACISILRTVDQCVHSLDEDRSASGLVQRLNLHRRHHPTSHVALFIGIPAIAVVVIAMAFLFYRYKTSRLQHHVAYLSQYRQANHAASANAVCTPDEPPLPYDNMLPVVDDDQAGEATV